jgi:hypothetical protein
MRSFHRFLPVLVAALAALPARAADSPSAAEDVISRLIERSKASADRAAGRWQSYRRVTVIESLDSKGEVTERKVKEHRVASTNGVEVVRLVKIDDHEPPERDARSEERKEKENRDRYAKPSGAKKRRPSDVVDETLFRRFNFTLTGQELVGGRTNFVLQFQPKENSGDGEIADRILGLLNGRIWVDAAEYELTRVDAHLSRTFEVLGGIAASIHQLDFAIDRVPLPDGSWATGSLRSEIQGRKVFSSLRSRMRVDQDSFEAGLVKPGTAEGGGMP